MKKSIPIWIYSLLLMLAMVSLTGCNTSKNTGTVVAPQQSVQKNLEIQGKPAKPLILFRSDRDGEMKWYTMNLDGSDVKLISFTKLPADVSFVGAIYEPDLNGFIMTLVDKHPWSDLYYTDMEGNIISRITNDISDEGNPSYDPQGKRIVYVCGMASLDICTENLDGTGYKNLTESPNNDLDPLWLKDGKILFISTRTGVPALWKMNADGTDQKALGNFNEAENTPNLSPDGKTAYVAREHDKNWEIFSVDTTSGESKDLTNNPAGDEEPRLSPDGKTIVFRSNRDGAGDLYSINVDGSNLTRLTNSPESIENSYSWMPDSSHILFSDTVNGAEEIFSVKADGSDLKNLTNNPANDVGPIVIGY